MTELNESQEFFLAALQQTGVKMMKECRISDGAANLHIEFIGQPISKLEKLLNNCHL
jgi:hypothetical protein